MTGVQTCALPISAVAIFVNGAKGHSALQLSRDLDCQYKTAFVLTHKIREALAAEKARAELSGEIEVDGAYFGGYVKPANRKEDRVDRRRSEARSGKRQVVTVIRERDGDTVAHVVKSEAEGAAIIAATVAEGSTIYADEASAYDSLAAKFLTKRINHSIEYANGDTSTNMAESLLPHPSR